MKRFSPLLLAILFGLPASILAADSVSFTTAEDGSTFARDASGVITWSRYNAASGIPSEPATSLSTPGAASPKWDPLTTLDAYPASASYVGPIFDSLGNAWVVINDDVNLMALQSNGTSGSWKAPHILGPAIPQSTSVGLAVDQAGGFYVTYGAVPPGSPTAQLTWVRYSPAAGWQAPSVASSSPTGFETHPSIDSSGRLVIVFDNTASVSSVVCNVSTAVCGGVQAISGPRDQPLIPSVASNKSGSRLALVYLIYRQGLRYSSFNSSTGQWDKPVLLPNSTDATFSGYGSDSGFPISVDEAGNITVVTALKLGIARYSVGGFRYEAGQWTATQLLPSTPSLPTLDNFASIALNAAGAVLVAVPTNVRSGVNSISVFRYTPGVGWDTETAATYNSSIASRCKIAWFEAGEAVTVYYDNSSGVPVEGVALFQNQLWSKGPAIPGGYGTAAPGIATAVTGEVLLKLVGPGVAVTWLRP